MSSPRKLCWRQVTVLQDTANRMHCSEQLTVIVLERGEWQENVALPEEEYVRGGVGFTTSATSTTSKGGWRRWWQPWCQSSSATLTTVRPCQSGSSTTLPAVAGPTAVTAASVAGASTTAGRVARGAGSAGTCCRCERWSELRSNSASADRSRSDPLPTTATAAACSGRPAAAGNATAAKDS